MGTITRSFANLITASGPSALPAGLANNTPSFYVTMSADQTGGNNSAVKINFDTEQFDTDNAYNTTTYTFTVPAGKAGKYMFGTAVVIHSSGANRGRAQTAYIFKNGGAMVESQYFLGTSDFERDQNNTPIVSLVTNCNVGDEINVYAKRYSDFGQNMVAKTDFSNFWGFKLL